MLVGSFRIVTSRLIPRRMLYKLPFAGAVLILAGCGGSSEPKAQLVRGPGFRFEAPAGWKVERTERQVSATHESERVQVATFPLLKPYRTALYDLVAKELKARMAQVATQVHGTIAGTKTVMAGGIRSHSYEVQVGDNVEEYTFVLRGMREVQLLCRRKAASSETPCKRLISEFELDAPLDLAR
jgi:hypothetical protein